MEISIIGQHIKLGNSLQEYVKSKVTEIAHKYFPHPIWTKVHFNKSNGYQIHCDIIINEGTGHHYSIKSDGLSDEIYTSFDLAIAKLKKQLRKYKSKLHDRHAKIKPSELIETKKYEISSYPEYDDEVEDQTEERIESDNPVIIAENSISIATLSVSQAVMIMDLEDLPAFVFKNPRTGRINVVYYKKSGNIAWIDTPQS
jgi:ribosomal subunit interface protein